LWVLVCFVILVAVVVFVVAVVFVVVLTIVVAIEVFVVVAVTVEARKALWNQEDRKLAKLSRPEKQRSKQQSLRYICHIFSLLQRELALWR
jgi:hypothetical protein